MFPRHRFSVVFALALLLATGCKSSGPAVLADAIYVGGPIVTVNDAQPNAEALAVKAGKILAVGARAKIENAHKGATTKVVDLGGGTLAPGFVDGHMHVLALGAQAVGANLLAPPDGEVETVDDLLTRLREFANSPDVARTGWIFGTGYDDALLGRHPNRDDLDKVSTEVPVIAMHISGHFSAVNSVALRKIGYTSATKDPEGGVIRRRPGSREPLGVNEETAHFAYLFQALSPPKPEDQDYFLWKGLELAKSFGHTTASEGRLMAPQHADLVSASERGLLDIDVMAYVDYTAKDVLATRWFGPSYRGATASPGSRSPSTARRRGARRGARFLT